SPVSAATLDRAAASRAAESSRSSAAARSLAFWSSVLRASSASACALRIGSASARRFSSSAIRASLPSAVSGAPPSGAGASGVFTGSGAVSGTSLGVSLMNSFQALRALSRVIRPVFAVLPIKLRPLIGAAEFAERPGPHLVPKGGVPLCLRCQFRAARPDRLRLAAAARVPLLPASGCLPGPEHGTPGRHHCAECAAPGSRDPLPPADPGVGCHVRRNRVAAAREHFFRDREHQLLLYDLGRLRLAF